MQQRVDNKRTLTNDIRIIIELNVVAYHVLTKLFLQKFERDDEGYILIVCSG